MSTGTDSEVITLPMEVEYQPAWLTWVASSTTCLKAIGIECDQVDVAGFSGYAFHLGVHEDVCPSGPTALDWAELCRGAHALGRATVEFRSPCCEVSDKAREESCRAAFDLARRELLSERPCVLWGTYLPEFGVVVGVRGKSYVVRSFKGAIREPEPPIPYDRIEPAGGIYVLGFPAEAECGELQRDLEAILRALRAWNRPEHGPYRHGAAAYDLWIEALRAGRAHRFGCGFNAACYAEGRGFARHFLERMSSRRPLAAALLRQAAEAYREAEDAMKGVVEILPFDRHADGPVTDETAIESAAGLLGRSRDAETRAMTALNEITRIKVQKPAC